MSLTRSDSARTQEIGLGWRRRAACRLMPAEMFFPVGSTGVAVDDTIEAKAVCTHCEVRPACLAFAIETRQEFGIWGGTDEEQRRELTRRARRGAVRVIQPEG